MPVAYNSIRQKVEDEFYVSQIAVKNEFKRLGIATKMMKILIELATLHNKNIAAHVRSYNVASIEMFKSLGFTQSTKLTKKGSYKFTLKLDELKYDVSHQDENPKISSPKFGWRR